jgi:hypothetical protein
MPLNSAPPPEHRVTGEAIELPLIDAVSAIRSHSASRITWHKHERFEMLFLIEGATAYEFPKAQSVDLPGGHFLIIPASTMHRGVHDLRMPATLCGLVFNPRASGAHRNSPFTRSDLKWMQGELQISTRKPPPTGSGPSGGALEGGQSHGFHRSHGWKASSCAKTHPCPQCNPWRNRIEDGRRASPNRRFLLRTRSARSAGPCAARATEPSADDEG